MQAYSDRIENPWIVRKSLYIESKKCALEQGWKVQIQSLDCIQKDVLKHTCTELGVNYYSRPAYKFKLLSIKV